MATIDFTPGSSSSFTTGTDVLRFASGINAASVYLSPGAGANVNVIVNGLTMTLNNVTYDQLLTTSLSFLDGSKFLLGSGGNDNLVGTIGQDRLEGKDGNDTLAGGDGNDNLSGGAGNDSINGGLGSDLADYTKSLTAVNATLSNGTGTASSGGFTDRLTSIEDLFGSNLNDTLTGDNGNNRLFGVDGADSLSGGAGNDMLDGGAGADTLNGGSGNDSLQGGPGSNSIDGGDGNDNIGYFSVSSGVTVSLVFHTAIGGGVNDTLLSIESISGSQYADSLSGDDSGNGLYGNQGNDTLHGGLGNDDLAGNAGDDLIDGGDGDHDNAGYWEATSGVSVSLATGLSSGGSGNDTLVGIENLGGSASADSLTGNEGSNSLFGDAGDDTLTGNGGNDFIQGGLGNDSLLGGNGIDNVQYFNATGGVTVNLAAGTATGADGNDTLSGFENIDGSQFNDSLTGDAGNNNINGGLGNDLIDGGGGTGDNASYYNATGQVFASLMTNLATGGGGNDTLIGIENLGGSSFADRLTGDNNGNSLFGDAGNDTLTGNDGNDFINGGLGNDSLLGGNGVDNVQYFNATGGVTVSLSAGTATGADGNDVFSGFENIDGSQYNDSLTGDAGNNNLSGAGGNDTLRGGLGNDNVNGGLGNDLIDGGDGTGDGTGYYDAVSAVSVSLVTNTASGGGGTDTLVGIENVAGSNYNDTLTGNDGNNGLRGENGADQLFGGLGNDYLTGGDGNDLVNGGDGGDTADYFFTNQNAAINVDLATGSATGGGGNDTLVGVENVNGTVFNDTLSGNDSNNFLEGRDGGDSLSGGAGEDSLRGGAGDDTLDGGANAGNLYDYTWYDDATSAVTVNLATGTASGASVGTDLLIGIEGVVGSAFNDVMTGGSADELFFGEAGNDTIDGGGGNNYAIYSRASTTAGVNVNLQTGIVSGGAGNDVLSNIQNVIGSTFGDSLVGSSGNNYIRGETGNDTIDGGAGIDRAAYDRALGSVTVSLATGTSSGADGNDTLINIENLNGSNSADSLTGSAGNNDISGLGGNDTMLGGAGNDTLSGGDGADSILGQAGSDTMNGNAGNDTLDGGAVLDHVNYTDLNFVGYGGSAAAVNINLSGVTGDGSVGSGTVQDELGGIDTLKNVNFISGSNFNDTILGSTALIFEQFEGGAGNDSIDGGVITDTLNSDNGNRLSFTGVTGAGVVVNLTTQTAVGEAGSNAGSDTFSHFNAVRASNFNDTLLGSNRTDVTETLEGRDGDDVIDGLGGFDVARYDSATAGIANAGIVGSLVTGVVTGAGVGTDTLSNIEGLYGSGFNDSLTGGNAANGVSVTDGLMEIFRGGAGNDTIDGGQGLDRVDYSNSEAGVTVVLNGDADGSALDGLGGTDVLRNIEAVRGSAFNDSLKGSAADESFEGAKGRDTIDGMGGIDRVDYNYARAAVNVNLTTGTASDGEGSTDTLSNIENVRGSRDFNDTITGSAFDNVLEGKGGNDSLQGGAGADTLNAGTGIDTVDGGTSGADIDTVEVLGTQASYSISRPNATDTRLINNVTHEDITIRNVELVQFSDGLKTLADVQAGQPSPFADSITGTAGDDLNLNGLAGNDTLSGLAGNDTYVVDNPLDVIVEQANEGTDQVKVAFTLAGTYVLSANVENASVTATNTLLAVNLTGNASNNILTGNAGANTLIGGDGNDTLDGGAGNDKLQGGLGDDTYVLNVATDLVTEAAGANTGTDEVELAFTAAGSYTMTANVERATVTAGPSIAVNVTGNALDNTITGNAAANNLNGGAGADILRAGTGIDTVDGGTSGADIDTLVVLGTQASYSISRPNATDTHLVNLTTHEDITIRNVELVQFSDGLKTLADVQAGQPSPFADSITGTAGDDLNLNGLAGNDTLSGLAGNDTYVVDNPLDVIVEAADAGTDQVHVAFTAAGTYVLSANVENASVTATNTLLAVNLTGNASDNALTGNAGANTLIGGDGADTLDGGAGTDNLQGGLGDDTYVLSVPTDLVTEAAGANTGTDTVQLAFTAAGSYTLAANVENATITSANTVLAVNITGNAADNTLTGNAGANSLAGGIGDDTLIGGLGNDSLNGGAGKDHLDAGTGIDTVDGGAGAELNVLTVHGNYADYTISRPNATDTHLVSATENITLRNVQQVVFLDGSKTIGQVWGNTPSAFADSLTGDAGGNTLNGLAGNDTLSGLGGNDSLLGDVGNDSLDGGTGNDTLTGGLGNDIYVVDAASDQVVELAAGGTDLVQTTLASYTLGAELENLSYTGTGGFSGTGNSVANLLSGGAGNDSLSGLAGNDTLNGGDGADTLDGGAGTDSMTGGLGDDTYTLDVPTDLVTEAAGVNTGTDTVQLAFTAAGSYTMTANVENATVTSANTVLAVNITGNAADNTLTGNAGANSLAGGIGDDTLIGGLGNDSLNGGAGKDHLDAGTGIDTVDGGAAGELNVLTVHGNYADYTISRPNATDTHLVNDTTHENITLRNVQQVDFLDGSKTIGQVWGNTPSAFADSLTGDADGNTLDGLAGNDTLSGLAGNDTYVVDNPLDVIVEAADAGTDQVHVAFTAAGTYVLSANVENASVTATNTLLAVNLTGNASDNALTGNAGANTLIGGDGNDTLDGGAGNDKLQGGLGDDTYVLNMATDLVAEATGAGTGTDTVQLALTAAGSYTLAANVENATVTSANTMLAVNLTGNAADNTLTGNAGANSLAGGLGDDTLSGGGGNDSLQGNVGDDSLDGGLGDDRYLYVLGDGHDTISDFSATPNNDVLSFGTGILAASTQLSRDADNGLVIRFGNSAGDQVTVANFFQAGNEVEHLNFANGASWSTSTILQQVLLPTAGDDFISGSLGSESLSGGAGNDTLIGGAGADVLNGGTGADRFVLNALDAPDLLADFNSGQDVIALSKGVFGSIAASVGTSTDLAGLGSAFAYDNTTGALSYDADGAGGNAAVDIAIIGQASHPASLGSDFLVMA